MSDNGQQAPLIERLRRVPAIARVLEHTPNPLGYDTASIPVGALCREAADRIAELEAAVQAGRDLMAIVHGDGGHYREAHGDRRAADDAIANPIVGRATGSATRDRRPTLQEQAMNQTTDNTADRPDAITIARANERRILRERLICAALTGMLTVSKDKDALTDIARAAILQSDAVLAALDKEAK